MSEKYYGLYLDDKGNETLLAVSKDKWLVELFIVQRKLRKKAIIIKKQKAEDIPPYSNRFLLYYFGYPLTEFEYDYVTHETREYESEIDRSIYTLENGLIMYKKFLDKKEVKRIKKAINILKKRKDNLPRNKKFAKEMIDTVIDRPGIMYDYMNNLDEFRYCMEGE